MRDNELNLLKAALQRRPATVAELAEAQAVPSDEFESSLDALIEGGHLSVADGVLSFHRPDTTLTDRTQRSLAQAGSEFMRVIDKAKDTLDALPELLQAWESGVSDEYRLHVDVITGEMAPADIWRLQSSRSLPRVAKICMPRVAPLFEYRDAYSHAHWNQSADTPAQVQFILGADDAAKGEGQERILAEAMSGVDMRVHPAPPSYFWITDDTVGIPATWGDPWPEQVIAIRSPVLAAALALVFEQAWAQAIPFVTTDDAPWDGMLHLMSQGLTIEAAAHACRLTARTGRRRVAAAMEHFGATSQFTLGAAWQKSRQTPH